MERALGLYPMGGKNEPFEIVLLIQSASPPVTVTRTLAGFITCTPESGNSSKRVYPQQDTINKVHFDPPDVCLERNMTRGKLSTGNPPDTTIY